MANEAGINLILKAPEVKSTMDEVIEAWKEITEREKEANKQLDEYQKNSAALRIQMKGWAEDNKKIAEALKDLKKADEEKTAVAEAGVEKQRKGLFALIREYFAQKRELKEVEKQIESVNRELDKLALRQRAIHLDARRGNASAIAEYKTNNDRIKVLSGSLGELGDRQDSLSAKVQGTNNKFAGFAKGLNLIKAVGVAAFAAVAVGVVALVAGLFALGRGNDTVKQQFEKTRKAGQEAGKELGRAFAPVAFAFGKMFELLFNSISKFIKENKEAIREWAIGFAGRIAYVAGFVKAAIPIVIGIFKLLALDLRIAAKAAEILGQALTFNVDGVKESYKEFKDLLDKRSKELEEFHGLESPFENGAEAMKNMTDSLKAIDFDTVIVDVKKLREEFEKLFAEFNKQLNDQAIKDAGPLGGIILKSEIAAKEVEKMGAKLVDLARKLGKSQEEIASIQDKVKNLAEAIRDDAFQEVLDQVTANLDNAREKLQDLLAKRSGADAEEILALNNDLNAQAKGLEESVTTILQAIAALEKIDPVGNKGRIQELKNDLAELTTLTDLLGDNTTLEFFAARAEKQLLDTKIALDKQINTIQSRRDKLEELLQSDLSPETKKALSLEFKVNSLDLKVAQEQLKQLEASIAHFKETGTFLVVETEVIIRRKFVDADIPAIPSSGKENIKESPFGRIKRAGDELFEDLTRVFSDASVIINPLLDIFAQAADAAVESLNRQLSAIDELIDKRKESIDKLEDDLDREAEFKAASINNDFELLREKLDTENAFLAADEQRRADIKKKADEAEAKRLKIKQTQDSLAQASSLISASANIWQSFSPLGPLGITGAVAAIALMFTAFAASKIQAAKLARAYTGSKRAQQTFGELAPGEGYDDRPGIDRGLSVVDKHGRLRGYLGGDEMIIKESVSKKHKDFLWHLNQHEDRFNGIDLMHMLSGKSQSVQINLAQLDSTNDMYMRAAERTKVIMLGAGGITKSDMQEAIDQAIKKQTDSLINYYESRPTYRDAGMKDFYVENSKSSIRKQT